MPATPAQSQPVGAAPQQMPATAATSYAAAAMSPPYVVPTANSSPSMPSPAAAAQSQPPMPDVKLPLNEKQKPAQYGFRACRSDFREFRPHAAPSQLSQREYADLMTKANTRGSSGRSVFCVCIGVQVSHNYRLRVLHAHCFGFQFLTRVGSELSVW